MSGEFDPNDVRAMRQRITRAAYGRGDRVDGKNAPPSGSTSLVRNVLHEAQYAGWSGEDTMTSLAYRALVEYERVYDILLQQAEMAIISPFITTLPGDKP